MIARLLKRFPVAYHLKRRFVVIFAVVLLLLIYFFKDASTPLRVLAASGFMAALYAVDHGFDVRLKPRHYIFMLIIAIASFILSPLYYIYPNYDKIQHFIQPIFVGTIILYMVSYLHIERKYRLLLAFMVTVAILGLFEIGEYYLDYLFDLKLQGVYLRDYRGLDKFNLIVERIDDTMTDMALGVLGSGLYFLTQGVLGRRRNH